MAAMNEATLEQIVQSIRTELATESGRKAWYSRRRSGMPDERNYAYIIMTKNPGTIFSSEDLDRVVKTLQGKPVGSLVGR